MANYRHYYFCPKCAERSKPDVNQTMSIPRREPYITLKSRSYTFVSAFQLPNRDQTNHYEAVGSSQWTPPESNQFQSKKQCQRKLAYLGWIDLAVEAAERAFVARAQLKSLAESKIDSEPIINVDKGVICIAYDPLTEGWYKGRSGPSTTQRPHIPTSVLNKIANVYDEDKMIFGRGCAEVEALDELLKARQNAYPGVPVNVDLRGCLFLARNKKNKDLRSMCNNCREWTQKMGIVDLHPA